MALNYPPVRKDDLVEKIHGISIAAPYRWLEDLESDETKNFVKQQQALTDSFLKGSILNYDFYYEILKIID